MEKFEDGFCFAIWDSINCVLLQRPFFANKSIAKIKQITLRVLASFLLMMPTLIRQYLTTFRHLELVPSFGIFELEPSIIFFLKSPVEHQHVFLFNFCSKILFILGNFLFGIKFFEPDFMFIIP